MIAYWRKKSTGLEEENVTLKAKVFRLQARVSELEKGEVVWKRESAELEESARSQRLKRRRDGESAEELGHSSAKRTMTKVGTVASNEHNELLQNLVSAEAASEWGELGWLHFPQHDHSPLTRQGTTYWIISAIFKEAR